MSIPLFFGVYGVLSCSALTPLGVACLGTYWLHRLCARWFRGRGKTAKVTLTALSALLPMGVAVGLMALAVHPDMVFTSHVVSPKPASVRVLESSVQPMLNDSAAYLHFTTSAADFERILAARPYEVMKWNPASDTRAGEEDEGPMFSSALTPHWFRPARMGPVTYYRFEDREHTDDHEMAVNASKTEVYFVYVEW